jgi:carboxyl-terminal processing protease
MTNSKRTALVLIAVLIGSVFGYGWTDLMQGRLPQLSTVPAALGLRKPSSENSSASFAFLQALGNIDEKFYGSPDRQQLTYAATDGMMQALKDPYTMLMRPEQADRFRESSTGTFVGSGGIGAELAPDPMGPRVKHVFKNGPAAQAGIQSEDIILKVNGKSAAGDNLNKVVSTIRGEPGTMVHLVVYRERTKQTKEYFITRALATIQDVYGSILKTSYTKGMPQIGYVELRKFTTTIASQYDGEFQTLRELGIKGLIIDLRGNGGGIMQAAVDLSARFIEGKLITSMKNRAGFVESYVSPTGYLTTQGIPIVLLVDGETASAAEIFAGAMKDYKLATIVGERTFGKGRVQQTFPLRDGSQAKITIGRYFLPLGESVDRVVDDEGKMLSGGIEPDVKASRKPGTALDDREHDEALKKAAEIIYSKTR